MGGAAVCRRLRLRRRRPARALPQGIDLALLPVRLHRPAPPGVADDPVDAGRLAGRAAARAGGARAAAPGGRRALESPPVLAARRAARIAVADVRRPAGD